MLIINNSDQMLKKYRFKWIVWCCAACLFVQCKKDEEDNRENLWPYSASILRAAMYEAILSENAEEVRIHLAVLQTLKGKYAVNSLLQGKGTALMLAAQHNDNSKVTEVLLNAPGIDINFQLFKDKDYLGYTALHFAATRNALPVLATLLKDRRIDVNIQTNEGFTALHQVMTEDTPALDIIYMLTQDTRTDLNVKVSEDHERFPGYTALHIAVHQGLVPAVGVLTTHTTRIDLNACNAHNETPLSLAYALHGGTDKDAVLSILYVAGASSWTVCPEQPIQERKP